MQIFKKEKRVVSLIFEHIDKTAECVNATIEGVRTYITANSLAGTDATSRVSVLESEADALLREIRDLLYSGAYLPLIRADIYNLMSAVDEVSNKAEDCFELFQYQSPEIPDEFKSELIEILDLTAECFVAFRKALKAYFGPKDKLEKLRLRIRNASELESKIDEKERALTARIFESSLDKSDKLHLRHALHRIVDVSDTIEDAADELDLVSVKSIV